jgi:hypothetical protein
VILFQVIALGVCVLLAASAALNMARGGIGRLVGFGWLALWSTAGVAIAFPDTTAAAARLLGITRGADLVFYLAILGMIAGFFLVSLKLRELDGAITKLTRHVAITRAEDADGPSDHEDG